MKYIEDLETYNPSNSFVAHISKIRTKEQLLQQLYEYLQFPDYFGFNWDALSDCLRDFSWIEEQKIVLVHDFPLEMDIKSVKIYLEILENVIQTWKNEGEHEFEVVFPRSEELLISEILNYIL